MQIWHMSPSFNPVRWQGHLSSSRTADITLHSPFCELPGCLSRERSFPLPSGILWWHRWGSVVGLSESLRPTRPSGPLVSHQPLGEPEEKSENSVKTIFIYAIIFNLIWKIKFYTLFSTCLTSLANSREQISRWKIFPLFETQAPSNYVTEITS